MVHGAASQPCQAPQSDRHPEARTPLVRVGAGVRLLSDDDGCRLTVCTDQAARTTSA